ncbi:MAG: TerB N-terminal domain-containing protein [Methanothrix sp.]|nr:TerB N-terminal domain-containing protein [Methanothrix sp.]
MAARNSDGCTSVFLVLLGIGLVISVAKTTFGAVTLVVGLVFGAIIFIKQRQGKPAQTTPEQPSKSSLSTTKRVHTESNITAIELRSTMSGSTSPPFGSRSITLQRPTQIRPDDSDRYWIPKGKTVQVAGYTIPYGMVYLGSGLRAAWTSRVEPALINPHLKVDRTAADYTVRNLDYWPSYSEASPAARASYLLWLSEGMPNRMPDPGYVFLYFYGLERRALHDAINSNAAEIEIPEIERSIGWLMNVSRGSESVHRYGRSLLDFLNAKRQLVPSLEAPVIHPYRYGLGLEFSLRLGIGHMALKEMALSSDWALAWFLSTRTSKIGTAIRKCPMEFAEIFKSEYQKKYGSGFSLPRPRTTLKAQHKTASSSFGQEVISIDTGIPDVCSLAEPFGKLKDIGDLAASRLQSFSRVQGSRTTIRKRSNGVAPEVQADARLLLPADLWPQECQQFIAMIRESLSDSAPFKVMPASELLRSLGCLNLTKSIYEAIACGLEDRAICIEPDTRFGGKLPNDQSMIVLFSQAVQDQEKPSLQNVSSGSLAIQLASAAAMADSTFDTHEQDVLIGHLNSWLHLSKADLERLRAKLELFKVESPKFTGLQRKLDTLDPLTKSTIGDFMVQIVKADGTVSPVEVKVLERIFTLLGLSAQELYGRLHGVATEPVSIRSPIPGASGYAIPKPADLSTTTETRLDMDKIEALKVDSAKAALLLGAVFSESREELETETDESAECDVDSQRLLDLDLGHSQLLAVLLSRAEWSREEFSEICLDHGLMVDGAIERINEASFEKVQQAIIEGDDPLEVRQDLLSEVGA